MIKVYTSPVCPRCRVLKVKLDQKKIEYENIEDQNEIPFDKLNEKGIFSFPVLDIDGELLDYGHAINWVNSR